jgi:N-methylhydantoinase B
VGDLAPGDVIIVNDPWLATSQLLDITVILPIWRGDKIVGFVANACHYPDLGGLGMGAEAHDVFEEGLFLPYVKLVGAHVRDETLWRVIMANVRTPELVAGDLEAAMSANQIGARRVLELLDEMGLPDVEELSDEILRRSEAVMRQGIRALKDGVYRSSVVMDGYGAPVEIHATITIDGDDLLVDYAGTGDQIPKGVNVAFPYTVGYTQFAIRVAAVDDVPNNAGTLAPIRVVAPEGSILNAAFPAATASRHLTGQAIPGLLFAALADADPPRCMAESTGGTWGLVLHGSGRDGVASSTVNMPGGTGARKGLPGLNGRHFPVNVSLIPIEVLEQDGFVRYVRRERREGSGGAGRWSGGDGQRIEMEVQQQATATVLCERTLTGPRGVLGGQDGAVGRVSLDGELIAPKSRSLVEPGARLLFETPGGGGWGAPPND